MICSVVLCVNDTKVCYIRDEFTSDQLVLGLFEESVHLHMITAMVVLVFLVFLSPLSHLPSYLRSFVLRCESCHTQEKRVVRSIT